MEYILYYSTKSSKYVKHYGQRVLFENGEDYCVEIDKNGREYFPIPNPYTDYPLKLFNDRIKDAITAVREGHGDCLVVESIFGFKTDSVYRFVDREYGEYIRQQTIDGFKNTDFGYSLKFGYLNSMNSGLYISKDGKSLLSAFDNQDNYNYFNTMKEAEEYKKEIINAAQKIVDEYIKLKENGATVEERAKYLRFRVTKDVISQIAFSIVMNKDLRNRYRWYLDIAQVTKPRV